MRAFLPALPAPGANPGKIAEWLAAETASNVTAAKLDKRLVDLAIQVAHDLIDPHDVIDLLYETADAPALEWRLAGPGEWQYPSKNKSTVAKWNFIH